MDALPSDHFITELQFTKTLHKDVYPAVDPTNPVLALPGKVVIVTGASRGIGSLGIAPAFAHAGVKGIVLVATNADKLAAVEASLRGINPAVQTLAIVTDITDAASVDNLFTVVKAKFSHADILVNNAGVNTGGGVGIHEEDPKKWWYNFEVNSRGAFLLARAFIRALPSPSTPATLINLLSSGAWQLYPTITGYSVSKLAALQLTTLLSAGYPSLTAVGLHPGMLETDMLLDMFKRFDLNSPALIGGLCVWLCKEDGQAAKFLSGRVVMANWDVDELVARKAEIEEAGLLKMDLQGKFGKKFFE